jgi:acetoin utilization deacetylase AcuC-like enzyme
MSPRTAFVCSPRYRDHGTGPLHPEQPARLDAIERRLRESGLLETLLAVAPSPAPLEWVTKVHSPAYVERVRRLCAEGAPLIDTPDVPITTASYEVALLAAGGVLAAVDAVAAGRARNAFCAVRPPGHHALRDRAMGFCLFNNVAIAARYAQGKHGFAKVLIADWDVHHGNGTQAAFYDDPSVFYFSVHQHPFYPGTGESAEAGTGRGWSTTRNIPLPAGSDDAAYVRAFTEVLVPAALDFRPDFVFISAGFDAHQDDPLGGMRLTPAGYAALTRIVKELAARFCGGRIVAVLEGGYDLDGLAAAVEAHIRALQEP